MAITLVTGGNIGNFVAEALAIRGVRTRLLVLSRTSDRKWDQLGIEQFAGDFASRSSLLPAFDGVDQFFSVTPFVENLVELAEKTIEAAKIAGVSYIVRSSAMGAAESAITMRRWHRSVEKALESSGISYTILQPNTFMQSYFVHAETIKANSAFYLPQGDGAVSLVDARDIAAVAVACLTEQGHQNKKYVITGDEALSNLQIAAQLGRTLGKRVGYVDLDPEQAEKAMNRAGMPAWSARALLELFELCKSGSETGISPHVEQILRRKPIRFDQFLKDHLGVFTNVRRIQA